MKHWELVRARVYIGDVQLSPDEQREVITKALQKVKLPKGFTLGFELVPDTLRKKIRQR